MKVSLVEPFSAHVVPGATESSVAEPKGFLRVVPVQDTPDAKDEASEEQKQKAPQDYVTFSNHVKARSLVPEKPHSAAKVIACYLWVGAADDPQVGLYMDKKI